MASQSSDDVDAFQRLNQRLRSGNRYVMEGDVERFVGELVEYAKASRTMRVEAGGVFFRARIHDTEMLLRREPFPHDQMGAPPMGLARAGRLNPEGIRYLYLASDERTAVAEVRPWQLASVTLAQVKVERDLSIVDLVVDHRNVIDENTGRPYEGSDLTWVVLIGYTFSLPARPDASLRYLSTQFLSEYFKAAGFDGVRYTSSLGGTGWNLALFNPDNGRVIGTRSVQVEGVSYQFGGPDDYR